jgi:indolepyruvate ferredoxin oxidoreductase
MDIFGRTAERRMERALIEEYRRDIEGVLADLAAGAPSECYQFALGIARIPEQIRGFGHVKERHLKQARQNRDAQLAQFRDSSSLQKAA